MSSPVKILIVGTGFGGTYALKNLHKVFGRDPHIRISMVGEKNYFLFTPLLHEVATGGIRPENIVEPIQKVLGHCFDTFHLGKAGLISLADHTVHVGEEKLSYDYLILAPGAETNFYNIPGAEQHSLPLKSLEDAITIKNRVILQMEHASQIADRAQRKSKLSFVVVGGGATGVELAAELQEFIKETFSHYYSRDVIEDASVTLIQRDPELVPQFGKKFREKSLAVLQKKGVSVMLQTEVQELNGSQIFFKDGKSISTENVIWVAGIKPVELQFDASVSKSPSGQLIVNDFLQMEGHRDVFVLGDAACFKPAGAKFPLPALAQVATKQGKAAAKNIRSLVNGAQPETFAYHSSGTLISLGRWMAIGELLDVTFWGHIAWWFWRTVYLFKLISWEKKLRVAFDWTINVFLPRDISQL